MGEADRFSVATVTTTYGWCDGCGWMLGPNSNITVGKKISQAATVHATLWPDHVVRLTTNETTTMKHIRWQTEATANR